MKKLSPIQGIILSTANQEPTSFKYFDFVMAAFVAVLLLSNLVGPAKLVHLGPFTFGAGVFFFPISYIFGDVLTEVYGYARSRRVIWAGFAAQAFATLMVTVILAMPAAPGEFNQNYQKALETALGSTWRIITASLIAFWCGEFVNSFVLAKLKVLTRGKWLWTRTIGSTIAGQLVDSIIFYPIAFLGIAALGLAGWTWQDMVKVMISNWALKTAWEIAMTPVTYRIVSFLKKHEGVDHFDVKTNFTPFSIKAE